MRLEFPAQPASPRPEIMLRSRELVADSFARAGVGSPTDGRLGSSELIPVFGLSLAMAQSGEWESSRLPLLFWRSFVFDGREMVAAVDYQALGESRVGEIFAIHREGELLKNTIEAIHRMETRPEKGIYRVRLLLARSLSVFALWLLGDDRRNQWFVLIPPPKSLKDLEAYEMYRPDKFKKTLQDAGNERTTFAPL